MIPQEKIEQAANKYSKAADCDADCTKEELQFFAMADFKAGVSFAETELKQIALEFAEWCGESYIRLHFVWTGKYSDQRDKSKWVETSELFDKFMAERQV